MIRIGVCFANALAMLMRCFCPPESPTPRSPMTVSYSSGIFSMKLLACASLEAFRTIVSSMYSFLPSFTFSLIVSENRNTSCITMEILPRSCFRESSLMSTPSKRIQPSVASYCRCSSCITEVFPAPVAPMMPTVEPASASKVMSCRISCISSLWKETCENSIFPCTLSRVTGVSASVITGFCSYILAIFLLEAMPAEKSFDSQPSISMGHTMLLEYSRNAPSTPRVIVPWITRRPPSRRMIMGSSFVMICKYG